jgi:hypothetical protein
VQHHYVPFVPAYRPPQAPVVVINVGGHTDF